MSRWLVTGCTGFLGRALCERLCAPGSDAMVHGTARRPPREPLPERLTFHAADLAVPDQAAAVVRAASPDVVVHLAGFTDPVASWSSASEVMETNVVGTYLLVNAVATLQPGARVVAATSSAAYGGAHADGRALAEDAPWRPSSPYGVSKAAQDILLAMMGDAGRGSILRARPFLVIGPRRANGAIAHFARGVVEVEMGRSSELRVGNLEVVRDFVDLEDALDALMVLARSGEVGSAYNICTGRGVELRAALDLLIAASTVKIKVVIDPGRQRALDEPFQVGDPGRLKALGWQPRHELAETLTRTLDYWRQTAR